MRCVVAVLLAAALMAPSGRTLARPVNTGPKGLTPATAIVLEQTDDEAAIRAEDAWLVRHYPGCKKVGQALLNQNGRFYDAIRITTAAHESRTIYFDITRSQEALMNLFKNETGQRVDRRAQRRAARHRPDVRGYATGGRPGVRHSNDNQPSRARHALQQAVSGFAPALRALMNGAASRSG